MNFGMLWFDNDPKMDLTEKIEEASDYYRKKYGQTPNQCMVNPTMLPEGKVQSSTLKITASPVILPNYLWIGFDTAIKPAGKSS